MRVALVVASLVLGSMQPAFSDGGIGGPRPPTSAGAESGASVECGESSAEVEGGLGEPVGAPQAPMQRPAERVRPSRGRMSSPYKRRGAAEVRATADVDGVWQDPRICVPSRVSEPGAGFDPRTYTGYYGGYGYGGGRGKGGGCGSSEEGRVPIPESFKSWKAWSR